MIADPSQFNIICLEDENPISNSETGAQLAGAPSKLLKCFLVLDYTLSMADPKENGDSDEDGISNAIETMEQAAKDFADELNIDSQIGIYEFHSDDAPQRVSEFVNDKEYIKERIDSTFGGIHPGISSARSRCWDAVYAAIQEFEER